MTIEQDALISDIFFHLVPKLVSKGREEYSRGHVSDIAGKFSMALKDCGIEKSAEELRTDFFARL